MLERDDMMEVILGVTEYCYSTSCGKCPHRVGERVTLCMAKLIFDRLMDLEVRPSKGVVTLTSNDIHELDRGDT